MNKLLTALVLVGVSATAAIAAPSHLTRDGRGGYNVTYDYTDKEKTGWYIGGRAELSFLNWKNKYSSDYTGVNADFSSDDYSFEPVFGGSVFGGYYFDYFWRGELELGYIGHFSDSDTGFDFTLSAPYVMANAYYDFVNGAYVGAGVGMAVPTTTLSWDDFSDDNGRKTSVSPMVGFMVGYSHELDDNLVLDLRYRLAGFMGTRHERAFEWRASPSDAWQPGILENKIGLILDNSVSIGLRYEF